MKEYVNYRNKNGDTRKSYRIIYLSTDILMDWYCLALLIACAAANYPVVRIYLDLGADTTLLNTKKVSALMPLASNVPKEEEERCIHRDLIRRIIVEDPDLIAVQNDLGNTALHVAVKMNNIYVVQTMLEASESAIRVVNRTGQTALAYAKSFNHDEMITMIEKHCEELDRLAQERIVKYFGQMEVKPSKKQKVPEPQVEPRVSSKKTKKKKKQSKAAVIELKKDDVEIHKPVVLEDVQEKESGDWIKVTSQKKRVAEKIKRPELPITPTKMLPKVLIPECTVHCEQFKKILPLAAEMEIPVSAYLGQGLETLSMAQLDLLLDTHVEALAKLDQMKSALRWRLEKTRCDERIALDQELHELKHVYKI